MLPGRYVDVIEQVFAHPTLIALRTIRVNAVVLVQIESHDVGEIQAVFLMHSDQLAINSDGCRTGGQTEHRILPEGVTLSDHDRNDFGDAPRQIFRGIEYVGGQLGPGNHACC